MKNSMLIKKVKELATQPLLGREQSLRVMVQIAIIRRAFGVKNDEHEKSFRDYDRKQIMTNDEIRKEFNEYLGFLKWSIEINDVDKQREYENQLFYFIGAVRFFDECLADEFHKIALQYAA